ncbi:MAG: LysE family transporter [Planctomycetota bacterium]
MGLAQFLGGAVVISLSGALAPGPMTSIALERGRSSPHAGAVLAFGHGIVEVPLTILLYFSLTLALDRPAAQTAISIVGGLFLLLMAAMMFRDLRRPADAAVPVRTGNTLVAGMLMSAANPYFLVWWVSVGAALVATARTYGVTGFTLFTICHWLCDLGWLWFLSFAVHRGATLYGPRFRRGVLVVCGLFMAGFGLYFLAYAAGIQL